MPIFQIQQKTNLRRFDHPLEIHLFEDLVGGQAVSSLVPVHVAQNAGASSRRSGQDGANDSLLQGG